MDVRILQSARHKRALLSARTSMGSETHEGGKDPNGAESGFGGLNRSGRPETESSSSRAPSILRSTSRQRSPKIPHTTPICPAHA